MADPADVDPIPDLSIIIPVWNEQRKIASDIRAAADFCRRHGHRAEILVADDGSTDGTAEAAAIGDPGPAIGLQILRLAPHRGKGYAVCQGMIASRGRIILFIDSGGCIPWDEVQRGIALIESGLYPIAHASRRLPASRILLPQSLSRRLSALLFRQVLARLLGLPRALTDTQAGLKIYAGEAGRALYRSCRTEGFLFDAEIILRARHAGLAIREFPVSWRADRDSRLHPGRLLFPLLRDAIRLKRTMRRELKARRS